MQDTYNWVELLGELPPCGYLRYGKQHLRFAPNPAHGHRRVEMLNPGYNAKKCVRYFFGLLKEYNPHDPKIIEENLRVSLFRDRAKWQKFLAIENPLSMIWNGSEWVEKPERVAAEPIPEPEPVAPAAKEEPLPEALDEKPHHRGGINISLDEEDERADS
jgi:hypothetical protein